MKLRMIFRTVGLSLFLIALMVFLYVFQNPKADQLSAAVLISFGAILAFSAAALITGEIMAKLEALENKVALLEEELKKQKQENNK